ncbi:MAG: hypothetical protein ACXWCX_20660 [Burkholderiales bacterium]
MLAIVLAGCAMERAARLYPANDAAAKNGVVEARFVSHGNGNGALEITMADGEMVKGEYSIVRQGAIGFGSIVGSVFGPDGSTSASAFRGNYSIQGGSPSIASAFGNKGTHMSCEFYNDNMSGHGYGACRSSVNALYRLQY